MLRCKKIHTRLVCNNLEMTFIHISTIHHSLTDSKHLYIIMLRLGDYLNMIMNDRKEHFSDCKLISYTKSERSLLHRDISSDNIICLPSARATPLIDFAMALKCVFVEGTARKIEAGTPWCGKKSHTAPEAIGEKELDFGGRLEYG